VSGASLASWLARLPKRRAVLAVAVVTTVVGTCAPLGAHVALGDVGSNRVTATAGTIQPGDLSADYATVAPANSDPRGIDAALPGATNVKECGSVVATFTGRRARHKPTAVADGPRFRSDQPPGVRSVVSALVLYRDRLSTDRAFARLAARTTEHCLDSVIVRQAKETSATHAGDRSLKVETVKSVTSRHSGARIGDRRTAYSVKVTIKLKRGSTTRKINTLADVQFVQVGRAIAAYVIASIGAPIEEGAWQPAVTSAVGRLEPASALDTLNAFRADVGVRPLSAAAGDVAAEAQALVMCLAAGGEGGMPTPHSPDPALRCNGAADFDLAVSGGMNSAISVDDPSTPAGSVVEKLVRAPYHGLTLALPSLVGAAYSDAVSPSGGMSAAGRPRQFTALDVFGAGIAEGGPTRPLMSWPAAGVSVPGTMTTSDEWPDPVRACGWQQAGPPMWVATGIPTGPQGPTPTLEVTNVALTDARGRPVATQWCRISRATNPHTDVNDERSIVASALEGLNAEVWLPSTSLAPGRYRVSWTTSYGNVASAFTVRR
jgi:hypothetical protein